MSAIDTGICGSCGRKTRKRRALCGKCIDKLPRPDMDPYGSPSYVLWSLAPSGRIHQVLRSKNLSVIKRRAWRVSGYRRRAKGQWIAREDQPAHYRISDLLGTSAAYRISHYRQRHERHER